ncbi:unnamed protein product [Pedinophyceae sp. YPF-701]|nr:unnamed protein product [Pedinophyceae sp. YPF-701]
MQEGLELVVKVLSSSVVLDKPKTATLPPLKIAEGLVGDSTGTIVLSCRNQQTEVLKEGAALHIKGARVDMFKGTMRLAVGKDGSIEETSDAVSVNKDVNMSDLEFDEIVVPEEAVASEEPAA